MYLQILLLRSGLADETSSVLHMLVVSGLPVIMIYNICIWLEKSFSFKFSAFLLAEILVFSQADTSVKLFILNQLSFFCFCLVTKWNSRQIRREKNFQDTLVFLGKMCFLFVLFNCHSVKFPCLTFRGVIETSSTLLKFKFSLALIPKLKSLFFQVISKDLTPLPFGISPSVLIIL